MSDKVHIEAVQPEVVKAELDQVNVSAGIGDDSAIALRGQFGAFYESIVAWRNQAATITDPSNAQQQEIARTVRLGLRKVRCDVENVRKALKADSLARGKAIDGFANVLKYLCEPIEAQLMDVEKYAERQEEARIAAIVAERTTKLVEVDADPTAYNLGAMDDETFALVLAGMIKKRDDRIEAERKAEAERIERENADRIAREKAEAEAKKLREEAAKVEAERKAERESAAAKQAEIEAKAKAEREAAEAAAAKERAEAAAKQAAIEAKARADREAREKLEREAADAKAKAEAEAKAKRDAEAAAERAPDKEKIAAMATKMRAAKLPDMVTPEGKLAMAKIESQIEKFATWLDGIAAGL